MLHEENNTQRLEDFYLALNESQKQKVEGKLKKMLKESYESLPASDTNNMRYQIASDMFKILKG